MQQLTIQTVQTAAERELYIHFPWLVYRGDSYDPLWVPPLISERRNFFRQNPFLDHATVQLFLAYRGTEVVGTISAHLNDAHTARYDDDIGFWGFFEVLDDAAAAQALLAAAAAWVRERGCGVIRGPMNWSINDECGLLIDGFDTPPVAMMTYNPQRYIGYIEAMGWQKAKDLYAWHIDAAQIEATNQGFLAKIKRVAQIAQRRHAVQVRQLNLRAFEQEVRLAWHVYNQAWAGNWGAIPMTCAEFEHLAHTLKPLLDPRLLFVAELDNEPVGVFIGLPDLNRPLRAINGRLLPFAWLTFLRERRKINLLRVLIMGVIPGQRYKGIDALLYQTAWSAARNAGYTQAELSWILEDNDVMNHTLAHFGATHYKTYRIYDGYV